MKLSMIVVREEKKEKKVRLGIEQKLTGGALAPHRLRNPRRVYFEAHPPP
jgi:hypothetical protein